MQEHLSPLAPGGTLGHMHDVLDGLSPQEAMVALEHEFHGCKAHLSHNPEAVWAQIPDLGFTATEPNAYQMWQVLAAEMFRRYTRALVSAAGAA